MSAVTQGAAAANRTSREESLGARIRNRERQSPVSMLYRLGSILALACFYLVPGLAVMAALYLLNRRSAARRFGSRRLVALLQRLGPAFIKGGQILGTRRDLLPLVLCDELSVLQDCVAALTPAQRRSALKAVYGSSLEDIFERIEPQPVASGSIASVYQGRLLDGRDIALKLQRPGIQRIIVTDLSLVKMGAALVARLPFFRGVPVREIVEYMCRAIYDQLDFAREAASLSRLRQNLSSISRVWVPRVETDVCRSEAIVMEFINGLDVTTSQRCSDASRRRLAADTLTAVYRMLFVDGFVHCDLHPGNLYFTERGHVIILDAGFSVQLSNRMRRLFAEFFLEMALGRGRRCGEIVIESSSAVNPDAELEVFITQMAALVERNSGVAAREFSLIRFATEMFDLQRRCGIHAAPELLFPLLSLLVIEGTIRDLDPEIDFQEVAKPILMRAVFGRNEHAFA